MKLGEAVQLVMVRFGADTLRSERFFNLVDDFGGFREMPIDSKLAVRELVMSGFSKALHKAIVHPDPTAQREVVDSLKEFIEHSSYPASRIADLAEEIIAGAGVTSILPLTLGHNNKEREEKIIMDAGKTAQNVTAIPTPTPTPTTPKPQPALTPTPPIKKKKGGGCITALMIAGLILLAGSGYIWEWMVTRNTSRVIAESSTSENGIPRMREYTPEQIASFIHRFGYALYTGKDIEQRYSKIKEIAELKPDDYWCGFIVKRGLRKNLEYNGWIWAGEELTDDEMVKALINAGFSPDPSKLTKDAHGRYIATEDVYIALYLFEAYHGVPPVQDGKGIMPRGLLRHYLN